MSRESVLFPLMVLILGMCMVAPAANAHGLLPTPAAPNPYGYDDSEAVAAATTVRVIDVVAPPAPALTGASGHVYDSLHNPVATNAIDDLAEVGFRSDTSHIFRDASGHLVADTAENRALIQSALSPENLRTTITLPDGSSLAQYFKTLPDGTQVWAEVRNGLEITNGGLNVIPR